MKPMLACSTIPVLSDIKYPVYAQPKLDGIRCLIIDGKAYSRNLKLIPNKHIQEQLTGLPYAFDGELILKSGDFNNVQSGIMSEHGTPDFEYVVFDLHDMPTWTYAMRVNSLIRIFASSMFLSGPPVRLIATKVVQDEYELSSWYRDWLEAGYEGAIVRSFDGLYKHGRSTLKQGWMLKLKDFKDDEAMVVGFEELMHNDNAPELNELGAQVRSAHQDNLVPGNMLGALVCTYKGNEFKIGTGFDTYTRQAIWRDRDLLKGKLVTFKFQELSKYGIPRFPVFKGWRTDV
jgi:DNA ligase-1